MFYYKSPITVTRHVSIQTSVLLTIPSVSFTFTELTKTHKLSKCTYKTKIAY